MASSAALLVLLCILSVSDCFTQSRILKDVPPEAKLNTVSMRPSNKYPETFLAFYFCASGNKKHGYYVTTGF